jgi:hypothetical protein
LGWRKGLTPWKLARDARRHEVERREKVGFYEGLGSTSGWGRVRRARLGGVGMPGAEREIRSSIVRAGTRRAEMEEIKEANEALQIERTGVRDHDAFLRDIAFGRWDATYRDHANNEHTIGERSEWEQRAALDQLLQLGGEENLQAILDIHEHADSLVGPGASEAERREGAQLQEMLKKYRDDNAGTFLSKMPEIIKGIGNTSENLKAEDFTQIDPVGLRDILTQLEQTANGTRAGNPVEAQRRLSHVIETFRLAATSEATNRRLAPGVARLMKGYIHGHLVPDAARQAAGDIDARISDTGNLRTPNVVANPSELRVEHTENMTRTLPDPAALAPATPAREAFKLQLRTDSNVVQGLARGIAYGLAAPEYSNVLAEMRNEAIAAGTAEAIAAYNDMVSSVQRAFQQRINETASAADARGHSPTIAREAATGRLAPEIVSLEATAPPPVAGPDFRKI